MLLSKAVEGYLLDISTSFSKQTVALYKCNLHLLCDFLHDPEMDTITPMQLTQFISHLRNEYKPKRLYESNAPLSPSAVDNYWKSIRSFFGWCNRTL
ncbi:MAG: phage integrase N-terminal SAM-like domain-containing protein, partial [Anaerolineaceae bacterium]